MLPLRSATESHHVPVPKSLSSGEIFNGFDSSRTPALNHREAERRTMPWVWLAALLLTIPSLFAMFGPKVEFGHFVRFSHAVGLVLLPCLLPISVRRVLLLKGRLGLFDDPYRRGSKADTAEALAGHAQFLGAVNGSRGRRAQGEIACLAGRNIERNGVPGLDERDPRGPAERKIRTGGTEADPKTVRADIEERKPGAPHFAGDFVTVTDARATDILTFVDATTMVVQRGRQPTRDTLAKVLHDGNAPLATCFLSGLS